MNTKRARQVAAETVERFVMRVRGDGPLSTLPENEIEALVALAELSAQVAATLDEQAMRARRSGVSWTTLGKALGISRQAAMQRYASKLRVRKRSAEHGNVGVHAGTRARPRRVRDR
jgi:hypothetical protein